MRAAWLLLGGVAALGALAFAWKRLGEGPEPMTADDETPENLPPPGAHQSEHLIGRLHPSIQGRARELLQRAANEGIALFVTQGLRTNEEQAALYAQGRTKPGPIVTNSPPGSSWHNFGLAFDVAEYTGSGKPSYPKDLSWWERVGEIGRGLDLEWGGDNASFVDRPHFEYHPGLTLADAREGKRPSDEGSSVA